MQCPSSTRQCCLSHRVSECCCGFVVAVASSHKGCCSHSAACIIHPPTQGSFINTHHNLQHHVSMHHTAWRPCRWVGVDSFFLRENDETCGIAAELKPYQDAGILDLGVLPGPKHPTQTNWYNECAKMASKKHSWVAFIDLDEFMIVIKKCAPLPPPHFSLCQCSVSCYLVAAGPRAVAVHSDSGPDCGGALQARCTTAFGFTDCRCAWRCPCLPHMLWCVLVLASIRCASTSVSGGAVDTGRSTLGALRVTREHFLLSRVSAPPVSGGSMCGGVCGVFDVGQTLSQRRRCRQKSVVERNALKEMLRRSFRYTSAVSMQWVLFGSGGHKDPPEEGQLAGFQRCTGVLSKQMKCLGNTFWLYRNLTFRPLHVHQCTLR